MGKVIEKKYLLPFITLTSLFFLWGVANDLTNPMVSAFKKVMPELSNTQAAFVQLAFYGGYFTMALPAALFIRKFSYKKGIQVGLLLYATGALLFYPAARYEIFGFFLASLYILTFGLAFLETTANPFVLSMGPKETATQRLNLAQTFNPIGSLSGMLIAQLSVIRFLQSDDYSISEYEMLQTAERTLIRTNDLFIISKPYVVLGIVILAILLIISRIKMPLASTDDQLPVKAAFKKLLGNKRYYEGVIAQAFYIGAQIMVWTFIYQYVDYLNLNRPAEKQLTATWFNMAAMICFLSGRALSTYLMKYLNAAKLMLYFALSGMIFTLGVIFIVGIYGLISLVAISFTLSLMFPTIYGIALKDMGDEAKIGSAGLVMAIVGGALMPPLQGAILDIGGPGLADNPFLNVPEINYSFILPFICLMVVAVYAYRNSFKLNKTNA